MGWLSKLFNLDTTFANDTDMSDESSTGRGAGSGSDARNRLKLVLMHDRTQLSPEMLENMRDELVAVISKYVEIDKKALDLRLESESDTMALVANIPVLRARSMTQLADEPTIKPTNTTAVEPHTSSVEPALSEPVKSVTLATSGAPNA